MPALLFKALTEWWELAKATARELEFLYHLRAKSTCCLEGEQGEHEEEHMAWLEPPRERRVMVWAVQVKIQIYMLGIDSFT